MMEPERIGLPLKRKPCCRSLACGFNLVGAGAAQLPFVDLSPCCR